MADILDTATARGELMSLEQAYALACELRDREIQLQKKTTAPGSRNPIPGNSPTSTF